MNMKLCLSIVLMLIGFPAFGMFSGTIADYSAIVADDDCTPNSLYDDISGWVASTAYTIGKRSLEKSIDHVITSAIGLSTAPVTPDTFQSIASKTTAKTVRKQLDKLVLQTTDKAADSLVRSVTGWRMLDEVPPRKALQEALNNRRLELKPHNGEALELKLLNAQQLITSEENPDEV